MCMKLTRGSSSRLTGLLPPSTKILSGSSSPTASSSIRTGSGRIEGPAPASGRPPVGNKRSLVFYEGPDSKKGKKTDWLMQEFVLDDGQYSDSSWVCCKIYYHGRERPAASSMDIPTNAIVQFNSPSSVVNHDEYESVVLPEMLSAEQTRRLGEIYANLSDNFPDATVSTTTTCEYVDAFLLPGAGAAGGDSAADLCCEFFFTDLDCSVRFDSDLATTTTTTEQLAATTKSTAECSLYPVAAETHDWDIPAMDTFGFDQDFL
ncbi:hypothetical protein H6P81_007871 [Aristolochia fimbriata]|uniref:NAC domain-containing protein n=1 Tax=Aristolochia fimbriata TaxID=158543 RepID=A0AAV7F5A0_ARIFI|nr:hypothetical protein H6P81_007871 [Aristolochia fimbriata]